MAILTLEMIGLGVVSLLAMFLSLASGRALLRGDTVGVETHWGGLGGGTSGWRASNALITLLAAAFSWLLAVGLVLHVSGEERAAMKEDKERADKAAKSATPPTVSAPTTQATTKLPAPATSGAPAP